jgi:hypothetical protein
VIVPDDRDWTWVVERACPECGFDASVCAPTDVAELVIGNVVDWERLLADGAIRPGRRSDGASFTIDTISRYMVHDTIHHVWDVTGRISGSDFGRATGR